MQQQLSWGLALSGGALRATAHIGVLQELAANGLRPDYIAGTSMGGIIAALYAIGLEPDELATEIKQLQLKDLLDLTIGLKQIGLLLLNTIFGFLGLSPNPLPAGPVGLIKGRRLENFLATKTKGKSFADLRLPCALVAVDLHSSETVIFTQSGLIQTTQALPPRSVVITDAPIHEAIRASISIPGLFEPKLVQGRQLIDGAFKDNVPVQALKFMGADCCVAATIKKLSHQRDPIDTIPEVLTEAMEIMGAEMNALKLDQYADFCLSAELYDVRQYDLAKVEYCIEQGRQAVRKVLPDLRRALAAAGPPL